MFKKNPETALRQEAIVRLYSELDRCQPEDPEYKIILDRIIEIETHARKTVVRVSPDVLVNAGVNLIGIGAVLQHERLNIITSKAFGWIKRT